MAKLVNFYAHENLSRCIICNISHTESWHFLSSVFKLTYHMTPSTIIFCRGDNYIAFPCKLFTSRYSFLPFIRSLRISTLWLHIFSYNHSKPTCNSLNLIVLPSNILRPSQKYTVERSLHRFHHPGSHPGSIVV